MSDGAKDDALTLIAVSASACIFQDVAHEGLGHAVTAWLSGAHHITISTVAESSEIESSWISASGTLVNLFCAFVFWLLLVNMRRAKPVTRYFLVLGIATGLFTGTGYFLFSGVMNFGDWGAVIRTLTPHWLWRLGLIVAGVATYYLSMLIVGMQLRPFSGEDRSGRIRRLAWTPYFTAGVLAFVAGLFNPLGLFYVIASALPSTLGANAGLVALPSVMRQWRPGEVAEIETIPRSLGWIVVAAIASGWFIFVLGRGLTWSH